MSTKSPSGLFCYISESGKQSSLLAEGLERNSDVFSAEKTRIPGPRNFSSDGAKNVLGQALLK
jgi:hypothetical protein